MKFRKLMLVFLIPIAVVGLFLVYLLIEDGQYPKYRYREANEENRWALLLTWKTHKQSDFWKGYRASGLFNLLKTMHDNDKIELTIPLEHKPLSYIDETKKWTNCTIVLFNPEYDVERSSNEIVSFLEKNTMRDNLFAADIMRLQRGLDMFFPLRNGMDRESDLLLTVEYLFSNPKHREAYYQEQYKWSGPAMADLHSRDKAGRFIGFEMEKRLFGNEELPKWDLLHVVGFTRWQTIKSIPFFLSTWNKHAKRAFGGKMTFGKKLKEWDKIRVNVKSSATQNMKFTLN